MQPQGDDTVVCNCWAWTGQPRLKYRSEQTGQEALPAGAVSADEWLEQPGRRRDGLQAAP